MSRLRSLAILLFGLALFALAGAPLRAERAVVAVAANFAEPARRLAALYQTRSGHRITLVAGASGKLAAQIVQGAPFDLFLSADRARLDFVIARGLALPETRITYALGRIVLWSPDPARIGPDGLAVLRAGGFARLAIANPRLAPYGQAAQQALTAFGLWDALQDRLVYGQNVGQAFSLAATGNAELAIVARSYALSPRNTRKGSLWEIPASAHAPIRQDGALLKRAAQNPAARGFLAFLRSDAGRAVIREYGYEVPG